MGKTFRRVDKDDNYHDVKYERNKSSYTRQNKKTERDIDEESFTPKYKKNK